MCRTMYSGYGRIAYMYIDDNVWVIIKRVTVDRNVRRDEEVHKKNKNFTRVGQNFCEIYRARNLSENSVHCKSSLNIIIEKANSGKKTADELKRIGILFKLSRMFLQHHKRPQ